MKKKSIYFPKQCFKNVGVIKTYFLVINHRICVMSVSVLFFGGVGSVQVGRRACGVVVVSFGDRVGECRENNHVSVLSPIPQFEFLNKQLRSVLFSSIVYLSSIYISKLIFCAKCDHNFGLDIPTICWYSSYNQVSV